MHYRLGVIGGGAMGGSIIRGAVNAGVVAPDEVIVVDPNEARRLELSALGCASEAQPADVKGAEQLMLAVKPQMFTNVATELGPVDDTTIVISVMAGLASADIRGALGGGRIIRTMPNTPARIGAGMTAVALGAGAAAGDEAFAMEVFKSVGEVIPIDEEHMNAVTALSGSGPAYVFLLAETMEQAGVQLGLDPHVSRRLAYQTVFGAGALLADASNRRETAEALRSAVTSPGGTTAAALEVMFESELPQIVADAMLAARDRGEELAVPTGAAGHDREID